MPRFPDSHIHYHAAFSAETTRLLIQALRYYANRLESDLQVVRDNSALSGLLDEEATRTFPIAQEISELRRHADYLVEKLKHAEQWGDYEMPISHGLVRKYKSICMLYLTELERQRDYVSSRHAFTMLGMEAIDTKLSAWLEKLAMPLFREAELVPLQFADVVVAPSEPGVQVASDSKASYVPAPKVATTIEIVDQQLRERCLDLFNEFNSSNQSHRFDTVVNEATRVLEDRIRKLAGLGEEVAGVDLMTKAFSPKAVILRLSTQDAEQEAAHLLFRGAFGFIRNPAHHRLIEKLEKERVLQILGFIDYLLYLTHTAVKEPKTA